jgi:hypothetical protein
LLKFHYRNHHHQNQRPLLLHNLHLLHQGKWLHIRLTATQPNDQVILI